MTPPTSARRRELLTILLVAAGVLLRVAQYLANRSLWLDEAYLASTILRRPWSDILVPPDYGQLAPVGFLVLERAAVAVFGGSEYALRLVPLLAGIATLFVFRRLAARVLPATAVPFAVALAAFNEPLIYFSSEVKPYALDLAVALALLGLAMDGSAASRDGFPRLALAGAAAVWLSFPAVFTLAACGLAIAFSAWRRQDRPGLAAAGGASLWWATSFAVYYAVSLSKFVRASWVLDFWSQAFLPFPPRSLSDLYWPAHAFGALFADPGGIGFRGLAIFCFLVGAAVLWHAKRFHLALLLGPMLAALAGSGFKLYPFQGRVLLFVVPAILLLVAGGAERVRELAAGRMKGVYALLVFLLLFHPVLFATRALLRPRTREELKPVLGQLQARRQAGERIYVYAKAEPAFAYYAARYGLDRGPVLTGTWSGDEAGARRDLETLRGGGRTWIVLSHTWRPDGSSDETRFLPLLDAAGRRVEEFRAPGAAVYLYDMTPRPAGGAGS